MILQRQIMRTWGIPEGLFLSPFPPLVLFALCLSLPLTPPLPTSLVPQLLVSKMSLLLR